MNARVIQILIERDSRDFKRLYQMRYVIEPPRPLFPKRAMKVVDIAVTTAMLINLLGHNLDRTVGLFSLENKSDGAAIFDILGISTNYREVKLCI